MARTSSEKKIQQSDRKIKLLKKQARKLRGRYPENDKRYVGEEPSWENIAQLSEEAYNKLWKRGKYFYYYYHDAKELRPFVVDLFGTKWNKKEHQAFNRLKDWEVGAQIGVMCKMILDGARWPEADRAWAEKHVAALLKKGAAIKDETKEEVAPKKVINIQDRLQDIRVETIGDLEEIEDAFIRTGQPPSVNVLNWLRQKNIPQQIIPAMEEFYAERLAFVIEARDSKDVQIREGYAHYKKKTWDMWIKWYNDIITDLDAYRRVKVASRKPRVRKPLSPEKLVRKLKYQKDAADLNIVSVNPKEIIGAQILWVYNTKSRKLGKYVASDLDKVLSVKGSTILGWDPKASVCKTLRKPKEQLKEFMNSGKVQLRSYLDKIKATEVKMNGRINAQTILLRADK